MSEQNTNSTRQFSITLYKSILKTTAFETETYPSWFDLVTKRFTTHFTRPLDFKLLNWAFGPYVLRGSRGENTRSPKRSDACVRGLSLAVFDADQGDTDSIQKTIKLLSEHPQGPFSYALYSSHSYDPAKRKFSYRLIIPLSEDVADGHWKALRLKLIEEFQIPADPQTSSALSQPYFLPAVQPGVTPISQHADAKFLNPYGFVSRANLPKLRRHAPVRVELEDDPPLPDPLDLTPYREILFKAVNRMEGRRDYGYPEKQRLLTLLLAGEPLAPRGQRDIMTTRTAGIVAWILRDTPLNVQLELFRPSLEKMQDAGSKLTERSVYAKLKSAAIKRTKKQQEEDEKQKLFAAVLERNSSEYRKAKYEEDKRNLQGGE